MISWCTTTPIILFPRGHPNTQCTLPRLVGPMVVALVYVWRWWCELDAAKLDDVMRVDDANAIAKRTHTDSVLVVIFIIASYERYPLYEIGLTS